MIAGLLFVAGMRRSEVRARPVERLSGNATDGDGILVTVRLTSPYPETTIEALRLQVGAFASAVETARHEQREAVAAADRAIVALERAGKAISDLKRRSRIAPGRRRRLGSEIRRPCSRTRPGE